MKLRTFLLDDTENDRGWRVPWEVIKATAQSWIQIDGIAYEDCSGKLCEFEHTDGESLQDALKQSAAHAVTKIIDVELDESTHTAYAVHETDDAEFLSKLDSGEIFAVSPSVWLEDPQQFDPVLQYTPIHLAFLSVDGSYGPKSEIIIGYETLNNSTVSIQDMDKEESKENPKEGKQKIAMEDEIHQIHAMLTAMSESKAKPKEEEKKEGSTASASSTKGKSFDWTSGKAAPQSQFIEDFVPS